MTSQDEASLAKLKLLFWRYLDWRQRLKVLVEADALPPSIDRPIPQTMERTAIEEARRQGKLGIIWEAMMTILPESKRLPNPFK